MARFWFVLCVSVLSIVYVSAEVVGISRGDYEDGIALVADKKFKEAVPKLRFVLWLRFFARAEP
jgi:hypothetical protein